MIYLFFEKTLINPFLPNKNKKAVNCRLETVSYRAFLFWGSLSSEHKPASSMGEFKRNLKIVKCETCVCQLCQTYHLNITFLNISEYIYLNINMYISKIDQMFIKAFHFI